MSSELRASDKKQLEAFVDGHGLATVCEMLAEICEDKAEHIRANWQDIPLAEVWATAGARIQREADRMDHSRVLGGRS